MTELDTPALELNTPSAVYVSQHTHMNMRVKNGSNSEQVVVVVSLSWASFLVALLEK